MNQESEIDALNKVSEALNNLDRQEIRRVIEWLIDRFNLTADELSAESTLVAGDISETQQIDLAEDETESGKIVHRYRKKQIQDYDTALDLFAEAKIKKSSDKVLLMAAFLQERMNFKEIAAHDISFRLKRIKHSVSNVSSLLSGLLQQEPAVMVEITSENPSKYYKKKIQVTKIGLKLASRLI
jgi:hypothetical protein